MPQGLLEAPHDAQAHLAVDPSKPSWDPIVGGGSVTSPPIVEPDLVATGMFVHWGYGIWILTHGNLGSTSSLIVEPTG